MEELDMNKTSLEDARNEILYLEAMLTSRQNSYKSLGNMPETIIQNYIFEKHILDLVNCIEQNILDAYYGRYKESE